MSEQEPTMEAAAASLQGMCTAYVFEANLIIYALSMQC